ncbi:MAG: LytTR family DNA-binding domain-containing protein [Acidobacteriota bacterium]|nr:MAG: DNA-binding response regulator [Acidobacteriota bacterium]
MKLKALIVEDEPPARRRLARLLEETGRATVVGEADTVRDAVQKIRQLAPDVVFLDIQIPGGDGFEVLARLDEVPPVVFVTAHDEFAVKAFEADAVDYVVKPVNPERLGDALGRVERRIEKGRAQEGVARLLGQQPGMPPRILARRRGRIVLLDPAEVSHITADHTLVFAWREGQSLMVPRTLQELEDELAEHGFRRTHRSALVNLAWIAAVHPGESGNYVLELKDEARSQVPLSRRRARLVRREIGF